MISTALGEAWDRTASSGEENGLFMVYDAKANSVHVGVASQGTHIKDPSGGSMPAMPNYGKDYNAFVKSLGMKVSYLTDVHTHPFKSDYPSGHDVQALHELGGAGAKGLIMFGKGKFSIYSIVGKVPYPESAMKDCLTERVNQNSVHVRFRQ